MIYRFNSYEIDLDRVELRRGSELVNIEPQVFDLLVYLIVNQDRVVSSDELFDQIWKGRIVSLSTLTTRINAARNAIGDSGAEQKLIKTLNRKGYRFIGQLEDEAMVAKPANNHDGKVTTRNSLAQTYDHQVQFCTSGNNVRIAYSKEGAGPPLVRVGNWFSHLEYDWDGPVWGHMLKWLASTNKLIRYDMRGIGLSDHDVQELSFDAFVRDLEAVVNAAGLEQFILFGTSDGAAIAAAYAAKHPQRVSKLIFLGGYAQGSKTRGREIDSARADATVTMMRAEGGIQDPFFQMLFTEQFIPDGTPEQKQWLQELSKEANAAANAVRKLEVTNQVDILDVLPHIKTPTLVMHCRNDSLHPLEQGRMLAAHIPGAKFVTLEGNNHALLEQDLDWPKFQTEFTNFLTA